MHHALGPMPGTSLIDAADVILGECSILPVPQLPARGVGSDPVGRTCALLPFPVEAGPRSWQFVARPQLVTRRAWDRLEADLDECESVWGTSVETVKVQAVGPWTLAASLEMSNGHLAITDRGAFRDLREGLAFGLCEHVADVRKRFGGSVVVQIDEPLLGAVNRGSLRGTTQWETIPPVAAVDLAAQLIPCDILHLSEPLFDAALGVPAVFIARDQLRGSRVLDAFGELHSQGVSVGLGIEPARIDELGEKPRAVAVDIAKLWDELTLDRSSLVDVDIYPVGLEKLSLADAGAAIAFARVVSEMLVRDAGDL